MPAPGSALDVRDEPLDAVVVETEAVDERFGLGDPEKPRLRIAGLRARGHRSAFDETESESGETVDVRGILVEAGRETDPIRKLKSHRGDRRRRKVPGERVRRAAARREIEAGERHLVRGLGVEREQQGAKQRIDHSRGARSMGPGDRSLARRRVWGCGCALSVERVAMIPFACSSSRQHLHGSSVRRAAHRVLRDRIGVAAAAPAARAARLRDARRRSRLHRRDGRRIRIRSRCASPAYSRRRASSAPWSRRWIARCASRRSGTSTRRSFSLPRASTRASRTGPPMPTISREPSSALAFPPR